jgi:BlaI family penicillinase repressor
MTKPAPQVTDLELMILQRIWEAQTAQTVNQIVQGWPDPKKPGYTTILKTLQKMEAKGIVRHHEAGRRYAYESLLARDEIADRRLDTIIDRMFSGSRVSFAQYFIESSDLTPDELQELKRLVARRQKEESL